MCVDPLDKFFSFHTSKKLDHFINHKSTILQVYITGLCSYVCSYLYECYKGVTIFLASLVNVTVFVIMSTQIDIVPASISPHIVQLLYLLP